MLLRRQAAQLAGKLWVFRVNEQFTGTRHRMKSGGHDAVFAGHDLDFGNLHELKSRVGR